MLSGRDRLEVRAQEGISHLLTLLTYGFVAGWMKFVQRYRIPELRRLRREFAAEIAAAPRGPLLICANHLTQVDSLIIIWALGSCWRYLLRKDLFPWNMPERRHVARSVVLRLVCYLGKCILIVRQGPAEETRRTLEKASYLLARGQALMIFPEGGRSRVGRVDTENPADSVGRLLQEVPATRVLCVYARGRGQEQYSDFPRRGEAFFIRMKRIEPKSAATSLRGARDLTMQILAQLTEMENEYFAGAHRE